MSKTDIGVVILLCGICFGGGYCIGWFQWRKSYMLLADVLKITRDALMSANGRLEVARAGWRRVSDITLTRLTPQEKVWVEQELAKTGDPNFLSEGGRWK